MPTSECESCRDLAGWWGLKPLPKPVLQRVEADEPGIRRQQRVLMTAVLGSLPGELHRVVTLGSCVVREDNRLDAHHRLEQHGLGFSSPCP